MCVFCASFARVLIMSHVGSYLPVGRRCDVRVHGSASLKRDESMEGLSPVIDVSMRNLMKYHYQVKPRQFMELVNIKYDLNIAKDHERGILKLVDSHGVKTRWYPRWTR